MHSGNLPHDRQPQPTARPSILAVEPLKDLLLFGIHNPDAAVKYAHFIPEPGAGQQDSGRLLGGGVAQGIVDQVMQRNDDQSRIQSDWENCRRRCPDQRLGVALHDLVHNRD